MSEKNDNQDVKEPSLSPVAQLWRSLLLNALSLGVLMGLLEVCWTYLLPVVFPDRSHSLPDDSLIRFFAIAITADTLFILTGSAAIGIVISLLYKLRRSLCLFIFRPASIKFFLITGILSYLYRGNLFIYFLLAKDPRRLTATIVGVIIIAISALLLVLILEKLAKRYASKALLTIWLLTAVSLTSITTYYYNQYISTLTATGDIPIIKTNDKPNILLVTIDTLRADQLACYGNPIVKTPTLDALANDGHLFENAFCQVPYTTPSHCSIMTSLYMSEHGAINGLPMKEGLLTIADILNHNKYNTAAFVSCEMVRSKNTRLHRGFDYYDDSFSPYTSLIRFDELQFLLTINILSGLQNHEVTGNITTLRLLKWLSKKRNAPFFTWIHYFDPHHPYDAPEPFKKMYDNKIDKTLPHPLERVRYAGEVTYTDSQLGLVIKSLKEKSLYDNTFIIVTSDHGEAFGEKHGNGKITDLRHGAHLYDTTLRVPLIVKLPKEKNKAHTIKHIVELIDIAPTLIDFLDATTPSSFRGTSFIDLLNGNQRNDEGFAFSETSPPLGESRLDEKLFEERSLRSIRSSDIKYIENANKNRQELYNIALDPKETSNLSNKQPQNVKASQKKIIETLGKHKSSQPTGADARVIEQLRSLGYIGDEPQDEN